MSAPISILPGNVAIRFVDPLPEIVACYATLPLTDLLPEALDALEEVFHAETGCVLTYEGFDDFELKFFPEARPVLTLPLSPAVTVLAAFRLAAALKKNLR